MEVLFIIILTIIIFVVYFIACIIASIVNWLKTASAKPPARKEAPKVPEPRVKAPELPAVPAEDPQEREFYRLLEKMYGKLEPLLSADRYYSIPEIRRIRIQFYATGADLRRKYRTLRMNDPDAWEKINKIIAPDHAVEEANRRFIAKEKSAYPELLGMFDDSQAEAIIRDEEQMLVLAGAGSGKTRTIEGEVRYLLERKEISPSEILLISFTRATVGDLNRRELGGVTASTFHGIGSDIIRRSGGELSVSKYAENKAAFFREYLKNTPSDDSWGLAVLSDYFLYEVEPPDRDELDDLYELVEKDIQNKGFPGYEGLMHSDSRRGFTGQRYKSKEEARIANFL